MSNEVCAPQNKQCYDLKRTFTIFDLPNEVLVYIFSFLDIKERFRTELVCQHWRELSTTVQWQGPTKLYLRRQASSLKPTPLTDDIVADLLSRCGTSVKFLHFVWLSTDTDHGFTSKTLEVIGENCPNLVEGVFTLFGLESPDTFVNHCLLNIARGCPNLKKVCIAMSDALEATTLGLFLKQLPSLEYLGLLSDTGINQNSLNNLSDNLKGFCILYSGKSPNLAVAANMLMKKCSRIEHLGLSTRYPSLDTALLKKVLDYYQTTLKTLYFDDYMKQPQEWYEISHMLHSIEMLSLERAEGIDDKFLEILAEKCKKLVVLNIQNTNRHGFSTITDDGISTLVRVSSLRVLKISRLTDIRGDGIWRLASQKLLERVDYANINSRDQVLEEGCIQLANSCANLRLLNVHGNKSITNKLVDAFRSSLARGFLKGPVKLFVGSTLVAEDLKSSHSRDGLELIFHPMNPGGYFFDYTFSHGNNF